MTRTEFRLTITWPAQNGAEPHSYGKTFRRADAAGRARAAYEADGATVTCEVWKHAGEDMQAGWYRDARATVAAQPRVPSASELEAGKREALAALRAVAPLRHVPDTEGW